MAKPGIDRTLVTLVIGSALLSGCAVQATHRQLPEADEALVAQVIEPLQLPIKDPKSEPRWWRSFADPRLDQLVQQALAHNRDLQAAALRLEAELARLSQARDQRRPQGGIGASADVTRQQWSGEGPLATRKQSAAGVSADWQLDLFGRISAAIHHAEATLEQRHYAHQAVMVELVTAVVDSYAQLGGTERELSVLSRQITSIEASVTTLKYRVDEGLATPLELYRAEALRHQYLAQRPQLQEQLAIYRGTLATLVGVAVPQLDLAGGAFVLPTTDALIPALNNPAPALLRTPVLLEAQARVQQAAALSDQAQASLYPEVSVSGVAGWLSAGTLDLGDGDHQFGVSPRLSWSLFNLSALRAGLDAAQKEERALLMEYEQTLLQVLNRADRALSAWTARSQGMSQLRQRHQFAVQAFDQAKIRYEEGAIPYVEFLDAQRDLLESEAALVQMETAWTRAFVGLNSAFSGGWLAVLI